VKELAENEEPELPLQEKAAEKPVKKKARAAKKSPKKAKSPEKKDDFQEAKAGKQAGKAKNGENAKQPEKKAGPGKNGENAFTRLVKEKPMAVAAVACIAIIAVSIILALSQKNISLEDFLAMDNGSGEQPSEVKMIVLTSNRCPDCENFSSLGLLFNKNGVKFAVQEIEENTEDGKNLLQFIEEKTSIKSLPAYFIDERTISGSMLVKTNVSGFKPLKDVLQYYVGQGKGAYNEGTFVFPEMNLDDGPVKPMLLLGEACGSKENFNIQLFLDPYDPNTIAKSKDLENMRGGLRLDKDINVSFNYNFLPTYSQTMEKNYLAISGGKPETVRENIEGAARYLVCANGMGDSAFINMERSLYSTYCDVNWSTINTADPAPLLNCSDSNHFNTWINGDELTLAARRAGLEGNLLFNNCLYNAKEKMGNMLLLAEAAGIDRTPSALINCQYVVPIVGDRDYILTTMCIINSDLVFC